MPCVGKGNKVTDALADALVAEPCGPGPCGHSPECVELGWAFVYAEDKPGAPVAHIARTGHESKFLQACSRIRAAICVALDDPDIESVSVWGCGKCHALWIVPDLR